VSTAAGGSPSETVHTTPDRSGGISDGDATARQTAVKKLLVRTPSGAEEKKGGNTEPLDDGEEDVHVTSGSDSDSDSPPGASSGSDTEFGDLGLPATLEASLASLMDGGGGGGTKKRWSGSAGWKRRAPHTDPTSGNVLSGRLRKASEDTYMVNPKLVMDLQACTSRLLESLGISMKTLTLRIFPKPAGPNVGQGTSRRARFLAYVVATLNRSLATADLSRRYASNDMERLTRDAEDKFYTAQDLMC
jgi:hypothetical protein